MFSFGMDPKTLAFVVVPLVAFTPLVALVLGPLLWRALGSLLGWYLQKQNDGRRSQLLELAERDKESKGQKESEGGTKRERGGKEFDGFIGFFHPFW